MKAWRLGAGVANATLRLIGAPTRRWRHNKLGATKAGMKAKAIIHAMRKHAAKTGRRAVIAPFLGEQRLAVSEHGVYWAPHRGRSSRYNSGLTFCATGMMDEAVEVDAGS